MTSTNQKVRAGPTAAPVDQRQGKTPVIAFIIGSHRSGSTLLRLMITHHPQVQWGFKDAKVPFRFLVSENKNFQRPDAIYAEVLDEYKRLVQSPDQLIERVKTEIELEFASGDLRPRVFLTHGDRYDLLPKVVPAARYIHLIRDPRPTTLSIVNYRWCGNHYHAAKRWCNKIQAVEDLRQTVGDTQFLDVKYEDLVSQPQATLTTICSFLGLEYSDKMFDYTEHTKYAYPTAERLNSWQQKISKRDVRLIETVAADVMDRYGYQRQNAQVTNLGPIYRAYLYLEHRIRRVLMNRSKPTR